MLKQYSQFPKKEKHNQSGQHLVEYTIVIGVIIGVLLAMNPLLQWGLQGMIKVTADQIGNQQGSEQKFDERGHMHYSYTTTRARYAEQTVDRGGRTWYIYPPNDSGGWMIQTDIETDANLGFTKDQ